MSQQERATRTRNALILSAAEVFERHGYVRASLNEISTDAGVSRGALHFHFETKAAMAGAVESAATRALRQVMDSVPLGDMCALQALTDLSHSLAHLLFQDVVVRAGFRLSYDTELHSSCTLQEEWQNCVHQLVTRAEEEEALAPDVSPEGLVSAVVAATVGVVALSRADRQWLTGRSLTSFWQLLLPSVANPATVATLNPAGTGSIPRLAVLPSQRSDTERTSSR